MSDDRDAAESGAQGRTALEWNRDIAPGRVRASGAAPAKTVGITEILGRRVVSGVYGVGDVLPVEAELIAEMSVSRTTLREAVRTLVALGLLEVRPRTGTRVRPRRDWNLLNRDVLAWMTPEDGFNPELSAAIDEAREVFEPAAAALAATRASRRAVTRIRMAYDDMEAAAARDAIRDAILADRAFHLAILSATGNPILEAFDTAIDAVLGQLFRVAIENHMENFRRNLANHLRVLEAIERNRPEEARQAMLDTIWFTRRHLEKHNLTKEIR